MKTRILNSVKLVGTIMMLTITTMGFAINEPGEENNMTIDEPTGIEQKTSFVSANWAFANSGSIIFQYSLTSYAATIELFDITGKRVLADRIACDGAFSYTANVEQYKGSILIARLSDGKNVLTKKIFIN